MKRKWWKESVVYQIYPRSFHDSDGDGIGDLRGITQKLSHLSELGVDIVWLSPVYQSPNDDNGYDISNYREIMSEFGTLSDWDEMLAEMHKRGMKLVMDLVVNHTSDEHEWFQEAKSSKTNRYRDYYIWRAPKNGKEPNNWASFFGGSAWQYEAATGEYYLHLFSRKQPDLNWENPELRAEIYRMMRWWLDRGVDGFRMDVINMISKTPGLPDAAERSSGAYQFGGEYFINGPRLLEFLGEMKQEVLSHYDLVTIGETPMVAPEYGARLTHEEEGPLDMVFQFEHTAIDEDPREALPRRSSVPWSLRELKEIMTRWQAGLEGVGWNSNYLNNHDNPRSVSRFGDDGPFRYESATMLATFTQLLQGTPFIYQGEEIGMTNARFPSIDDYRDIETLDIYRELTQERGYSQEQAMEVIHAKSRDNARTPMQWDDGPNAGFTRGAPWIRVNPNYPDINAASDRASKRSIFRYYQRLIRLRRDHLVLLYGRYQLLLPDHERIYAFTRTLDGACVLVLLNFSGDSSRCNFSGELDPHQSTLLMSNWADDGEDVLSDQLHITLRPYEARVYAIE